MSRKLLVNADGFGFTFGINKGVLETIERGIVTSTSCVVNFPSIQELPLLIERFKQISVGVHFNLSVGNPVSLASEVPSLVNRNGEFHGNAFAKRLLGGKIRRRDMEKELEAQVHVMLDLGTQPTHWDGHQNKHLYPPFFFTAMKVARKYGILRLRTHNRYLFFYERNKRSHSLLSYYLRNPMRCLTHVIGKGTAVFARANGFRNPDRLISPSYVDGSAKYFTNTWVALLAALPQGVNEIYCHPGYPDDALRRRAVYVDERRSEIEALTSSEVKDAVSRNNIELISFHDL